MKLLARLVAPLAVIACVTLAAHPASSQQGDSGMVFMGYITDQFGQPVASAMVTAPGVAGPVSAVATVEGLYRLEGVALSASGLRVRRVGYLPVTVTVNGKSEANLSADLELQKLPDPLAAERVQTAEGDFRTDFAAFAERRRGGVGAFVDRREIEKRRPATVTDLVRGVPGFRVVSGETGGVRLVSASRGGTGACPARIYVEGVAYAPVDGLDDFSPDQIEAVEVYAATVDAPPPLDAAAGGCGVIALWLRR